jgi:hypothetical protein
MAKMIVELGRGRGQVKWARFSDPFLPGWNKKEPTAARHAALHRLTVREGCLTVSRKLNQLANVTRDVPTKKKARADQRWISKQGFCHLKTKRLGKY